MATKKIGADRALVALSALAADFKIGMVSEDYVRELLEAIVGAMDVPDPDRVLAQALDHWGFEVD